MTSRDTLSKKSGFTEYRLCRYFSIVSIDTSGRRLTKSGAQFSLRWRYMTVGFSGRWPTGLAEHGGGDAVGRPLHQLAGKAAADAVARGGWRLGGVRHRSAFWPSRGGRRGFSASWQF